MNRNYFINGSITVFLSLILCICILFVDLTFEFYKSFAADSIMKNSLELAAYTATADFDQILQDTYGLLKSSSTEEELSENLQSYMKNSLQATELISKEEIFDDVFNINRNMVNLNLQSLNVNGVEGSELFNASVLEKQIVEYMKYRGPIEIGENLLSKLNVFSSINKIEKVVENKNRYDSALSDIQIHFNEIMKKYRNIKKIQASNIYGQFENLIEDSLDKSNEHNFYYIDSYILYIYENQYFDDFDNSAVNLTSNPIDDENYIILSSINNKDYIEYAFNLKKNESLIIAVENRYREAEHFFEKNQGLLEDDEATDEMIIEAASHYSVLEKYEFVLRLKDDLRKIKENALGNFIDETNKLRTIFINNYLAYEEIKVDLLDIRNELEILKTDTLDHVSSNLDIYKESIEKMDEGQIKTTFKSDVDDKINNLNVNELNMMILQVNKGISYCDDFMNDIKSIKYRGISFFSDSRDVSYYEGKAGRVFIDDYENINHDQYMSQYSNIIEISKNIDKKDNTINNFEDSDFFKYIEEHSNIDIKKDINVHSKVDNINSIIKDNYDKEDDFDDNRNFVPDSGEIYEDLATIINESKEKDSHFTKPIINSLDTGENSVEGSKTMAENQMDFFNKSVGDFFDKYRFEKSNLESVRNELYILAYIGDKFINQTDDKSEAHYINDEMEYILFASKGAEKFSNKEKADALIFATRYLLNTTYAYTDSEIRSYTLSLAISLAGLTGFGVPIIQNVLILMISFAESVLDVKTLTSGNEVVMYKSITTWRLKPSHIGKEIIKNGSKTIVNHSMNKLFDKVNMYYDNKTDLAINELVDEFDKLSNDAIESTVTAIVSSILAPLEAELIIINKEASEINLQDLYESIVEKLSTGKKYYDYILREAVDYFMHDRISYIQSKIDNLGKVNTENIAAYVEDVIKDERNILIDKIKTDYLTEFQRNIRNELLNAEKNGKDKINQKLDDYFEGLNLNYSNTKKDEAGSFEKSSFLTMNYSDYISLYIAVLLISGHKDEVLLRLADVIKLNMILEDENFCLMDSYTMYNFSAKAKININNINKFSNHMDDEYKSTEPTKSLIFIKNEVFSEVTYGY